MTGEEALKTMIGMWTLAGADERHPVRVIRKPGHPHRGRIIHISLPIEGAYWVWGRGGRRRGQIVLSPVKMPGPRGQVSYHPPRRLDWGLNFGRPSNAGATLQVVPASKFIV